ncbi:hypothetical protein [Acinetobacter soli]|uniref:hypothetical protein n=1 Tax=Acinetobacter soli TaxID=487316 RepID=UPI001BB46D8B|nr:hypothetical protein [Acinetobacter soli]MBV6550048.1 hypothetical protein [Acinetobacter soli]MDS7693787.1 hypothetical protein [Acinetobacter soli]
MKRIDTVNARPDMFGTGKSGFHDNSDISGQDATYMSPAWLNMIQEELCNLLEKNGIAVNSNLNDQLFSLLATNTDLIALASNVEDNFLRKSGGTITGNLVVQGLLNAIASSAHKLQTARRINGILFDGTNDIAIPTVRAFANFNGNDQTFRKSVGIESIERVSNGFFMVTLQDAAPDSNYIIEATASWGNGEAASATIDNSFEPTTKRFQIRCTYGGDNTQGVFNPTRLMVSVSY